MARARRGKARFAGAWICTKEIGATILRRLPNSCLKVDASPARRLVCAEPGDFVCNVVRRGAMRFTPERNLRRAAP